VNRPTKPILVLRLLTSVVTIGYFITNGYNKGRSQDMASRQKLRSEETKQAILTAAQQLFAERGFDSVTMREIAKAADCSHTAIYIYFKDKEALLHQLATGPLQALRQQLEAIVKDESASPEDRLREISRTFLAFGFQHRNLYAVAFMAKGSRVDEDAPALAVQQLRNDLFALLGQAVQASVNPGLDKERTVAYARIHFFILHGILSTYPGTEEPLDALMARVGLTFELAVEVLLAGFKEIGGKQL
jgi:AcrR family transcriptional regulator